MGTHFGVLVPWFSTMADPYYGSVLWRTGTMVRTLADPYYGFAHWPTRTMGPYFGGPVPWFSTLADPYYGSARWPTPTAVFLPELNILVVLLLLFFVFPIV